MSENKGPLGLMADVADLMIGMNVARLDAEKYAETHAVVSKECVKWCLSKTYLHSRDGKVNKKFRAELKAVLSNNG